MAQLTLFLKRLATRYGMVGVLVLLAAYFSLSTVREQSPAGAAAAEAAARQVHAGERALIVADDDADGAAFAAAASAKLHEVGATVVATPGAVPSDVRRAIDAAGPAGLWVVATPKAARMAALHRDGVRVATATPYRWPTFLKAENLLNIANQVVVIALLAAGMTLVIITGGIDLSAGSLVALSAVTTAVLVRDHGGTSASAGTMVLAAVAGVAACAAAGLVSGALITAFRLPPFIATLGMMLIASGVAFQAAEHQSIYALPDAFTWLGRGRAVLGLPNQVLLMAAVYLAGHVLMAHTTVGRYIYAVGGNPEAARLSGVRVSAVLVFAYVVSGALAGLGGVVQTSQLKAGAPVYGTMYELYAIAGVVVGGTSLSGGSGRMLGTLIGVLIIAVIQNGMNLKDVNADAQKIVLGALILAAVTIDTERQRGQVARWSAKALGRLRRSPVGHDAPIA